MDRILNEAGQALFGFEAKQDPDIPDKFWKISPKKALEWVKTSVLEKMFKDISDVKFWAKRLECKEHYTWKPAVAKSDKKLDMQIIGIVGNKYRGKDTCADYLIKKYGFTKYAFANPLKEACKILFNFTDEQVYTEKKEVIDEYWGFSPRKILEWFGTEVMRNAFSEFVNDKEMYGMFWIKRFEQKVLNGEFENNKIVFSDTRFLTEGKSIKEKKGRLMRVIRETAETLKFPLTHASEKEIPLIPVDIVIENQGTLEELYAKLDAAMLKLFS